MERLVQGKRGSGECQGSAKLENDGAMMMLERRRESSNQIFEETVGDSRAGEERLVAVATTTDSSLTQG